MDNFMVNQCVSCGNEMPEGDMVCKACVDSWTINSDASVIKIDENPHYFINGRELDCDKAYDWFQEAINEKAEREKATPQESLPVEEKVRESAEIIQRRQTMGEMTREEAACFAPEPCAWCNPDNKTARFNVVFWVKSRRWHSMTQTVKARYCPICGRKLEVEG